MTCSSPRMIPQKALAEPSHLKGSSSLGTSNPLLTPLTKTIHSPCPSRNKIQTLQTITLLSPSINSPNCPYHPLQYPWSRPLQCPAVFVTGGRSTTNPNHKPDHSLGLAVNGDCPSIYPGLPPLIHFTCGFVERIVTEETTPPKCT